MRESLATRRDHAPQRSRPSRRGCKVGSSRAVSPRLNCWASVVPPVLTVVVCLLVMSCSHEPGCDVMSVKDTPSPDGRYIATVFEVFCYNTTGYTPHANLRRPGQNRGDQGNLLVGAPTDTFRATWIAADSLLLEYRTDGDYIHPPPASTNVDGVTVIFKRLRE